MSKSNLTGVQATIYGCAGVTLADEERRFFEREKPLGFILFQRNCESPEQIKALVASLRETVGRDDAPVLIDQEGGRVARLKPPHWPEFPPAARFIEEIDSLEQAKVAVRENALAIASMLSGLGINVDCAPLLDVPVPGSHDIIGDRAFSHDPDEVIALGRAMMEGLIDGGVIPIIKHIPGHGRAQADSHESLPVVDAPLTELEQTDFRPFKALNDAPWGMTAHIVYTAIDTEHPATCSPNVIRLIREEIGFDGLLLSDDLSMKALTGSFSDRTWQALDAGCDVVLHCNGDMAEMEAIAEAASPLTDKAIERLQR